MREILFRGKRIDNGDWVLGYYFEEIGCFIKERPSSISTNMFLVDRATIGQYTGLTDKNGTKIFEGDIVDYFTEEWGGIATVEYVDGVFIVHNEYCYEFISQGNGQFEVIGNIHESEVQND